MWRTGSWTPVSTERSANAAVPVVLPVHVFWRGVVKTILYYKTDGLQAEVHPVISMMAINQGSKLIFLTTCPTDITRPTGK